MAKTVIAIVVGVLCFVILMVALVGYGCSRLVTATADPSDIVVSIDAPIRVTKGQEFSIAVLLENAANEARTLVDVDVSDDYVGGVELRGSVPPSIGSDHIALPPRRISYHYRRSIPAHGNLAVKLSAIALHAGDFAGDVDFCVDTEFRCLSKRLRIVVEEPVK